MSGIHALETATIDDYGANINFGQMLGDYCDLIIWYLRQLNMPRYYCSEGVFITKYQRAEIFIDPLDWTVSWNFSTCKIPHTRTQFAYKLARCLAEHNAACLIIACLLPQPIAEEIIPQITARERASDVMGAYMAPTFETDSLI